MQRLDHDTLDPQVVAPHLLDELGIVQTFDPDARPSGRAGAQVGDGDGPRRGTHRTLRRCGRRCADEGDGSAVEQESRCAQSERTAYAMPVLEHHRPPVGALLDADHGTAEP